MRIYSILLSALIFFSVLSNGQNSVYKISPEAGPSFPIGDFKSVNVFAKQGFQYGINLDKMWGKFGLGLYGGVDMNDTKFDDLLPATNPGLDVIKSSNINRNSWKQFAAGIGPLFKLDISNKFDLDISSKIGFSKFTYPDFSQYVAIGSPLKKGYILYETMNEDIEDKLNLMLLSALRLNYKLTEKIDVALSVNYKHVRDVEHSYSFLRGDFNPGMSNEELVEAIDKAPTVNEIRKCHFNIIGVTLGISFNIGRGKDRPKEEKMEPPVPIYPEDGARISGRETDSLTLKWLKESPNVDNANYNLWLYKVIDSTSQKKDSLIFQTKVSKILKVLLPETLKLEMDKTYRWKVQAIDDNRLKPCPGDCYSINSTFKISNILEYQFYQLTTQNSGNYILMKKLLQFAIPKNIETGGKLHVGIFNQRNEEEFIIDNLETGKKEGKYTSDKHGMVTIDLKRFKSGYYYLELSNERNKKYYIRFMISNNNENGKN